MSDDRQPDTAQPAMPPTEGGDEALVDTIFATLGSDATASPARVSTAAITGYRRLTAEEIATINDIKAEANSVGTLVGEITAKKDADQRWVAIARTHLQQGFMALTRAVARPESF